MTKFIQHIPDFVDCDHPIEFEFETIDQLLNHHGIKDDDAECKYTQSKLDKFAFFNNINDHKFGITLDKYPYCLMLERQDGSFWVLGYLSDHIDLPIFDRNKLGNNKK